MIEWFGADPQAFIVDDILLPVVECWVKAVRDWGMLLESHAQNILLEIDQYFRPRRGVHRDFDVWVDLDVRRRLGLDVPFLGAGVGGESERPAEQHDSVVYDRFIGHEFFDAVLDGGAGRLHHKIDDQTSHLEGLGRLI
jgi:hypothetical protein